MRRWPVGSGVFLFLSGLVLVPRLDAHAATQPAVPAAAAEDLYESSVGLLQNGRDFTRAADQLKKALAIQDRMPYHVALGCALADRAATLAQATVDRTEFAQEQQKYQSRLALWEAAQKDPYRPEHALPRPDPPLLRTRDDQQPFTLTRKEARSQFKALAAEAQAEWGLALGLAGTPQEQAEVKYVRAWGRELIRVYGGAALWPDLPSQDASIRDMTEATQSEPKNAAYWRALGDIDLGFDGDLDRAPNRAAALSAYGQALRLEKTNAALCYRVYDLAKQDDALQAKEAIFQAAQREPDNAYPMYRFAELMLADTPFSAYYRERKRAQQTFPPIPREEWNAIGARIRAATNYAGTRRAAETAMGYVEQGNHAARYAPSEYNPQFPRLLQAAWEYEKARFHDNAVRLSDWYILSTTVGGYIRVVIRQGDKAAGEHAALLLRDMGTKMVGGLDKRPLPLPAAEAMRVSSGLRVTRSGYDWLITAYKEAGKTVDAARIEPEFEAFQVYASAYHAAEMQASRKLYEQKAHP